MKTYFPDDDDQRAILRGYYRLDNVPIAAGDPTGVVAPNGTPYVALHNGGGMLAVYRNGSRGWRRVDWAKVPVAVLQELEGNSGPAPEQYRVWESDR